MDLPTPTPPPPISGYRSRAINAAVDFAAALRPVAGPGTRVADGPGGKIISVDPRGLPRRPLPWSLRVVPVVGTAPSQVEWNVAVYAGIALAHGASLSPSATADGLDPATGLEYYYAPIRPSGTATWLSVRDDGGGSWELVWTDTPSSGSRGARWRAIAEMIDDGPPPVLKQLEAGVIDLGGGDGDGDLLPFDLAVIEGDPCIYLPTDPDNLVYVRGEPNQAGRDASAMPAQGDGGWVHLSPGEGQSVGTVWAWAVWDQGRAAYMWGVSTTDPLNNSSATNRYIASVEIGKFAYDDEAEEYTVEAQYRHGSLIVADDQVDDLSVGRDGYDQTLALRQFQAGQHTGAEWDEVDYLVREERDGEYPHRPYRLNYLAGSTLRTVIADLASQIVQDTIDELIADLIGELGGSAPGDLVGALDDRYQPICTEADPSWGVATGAWTQTYPPGLSQELASVDAALQSLDARVTALENSNAAAT